MYSNPWLPVTYWWGTGWGMLGYGFKWGMRCPTRTPTPTKPINLPQGFPYPCQSLFMIVEKSFINFGVTILLCQNLIAIPLARLPPSVFRSSCPHPLLQRKMNLETETQSQVPKKAECVNFTFYVAKIYIECIQWYISPLRVPQATHIPSLSSTLNDVIFRVLSAASESFHFQPLYRSCLAAVPQQRDCGLLLFTWSMCTDRLVSYFSSSYIVYRSLTFFSLRPTSNGDHIEPNGLRAWLRRCGLHWSCFCPLETGEPMSCQIVHGINGRVFTHCGQSISHCGFRCKYAYFSYDILLYSFFRNLS